MKLPQLAGVIVTSMVIILVVVSVLIPIIQESDATRYVDSENTGEEYTMSKADATYSLTVTLTTLGADSATYTIGTATKTITGTDTSVYVWDNGFAILRSTGMAVKVANANLGVLSATAVGDTFTFNGTGYFRIDMNVGTDNASYKSSPYTWVIHPDANGDLGAFEDPFKISKGNSFYVFGKYQSFYFGVAGYGTATSVTTLIAHENESATFTVDSTESDTYYDIVGCTIKYTGSNQTDREMETWLFIAPMDYVSGVEQGSGIVNTLLGIVPVLIIVGVVMAVVGFYMRGRDY